jgi:quinoprotein relay system zinc metallohydrolase 1
MRLTILLLSLLLALPLQAAALKYDLQPLQIAKDTWLLEGSTENFSMANGGNIVNVAFIVGTDGVILIDTGISRRYGEALRAAIASVTDKPVALVINTHHHPDHAFGNQAFQDVPIAALADTRRLLQEQGPAFLDNMYRTLGDWMRGTEILLPQRELEGDTLEVAGRRLRLLHLRGHTGADLALLDETSGVLFAGDILFYQRALTTPQSPGLDVWLADLDRLQALDFSLLVPGHGPVSHDHRPIAQMRDYLGWLDGLLRDGVRSGQTMNEVMSAPIPARFAGISLTRYELIRTVTHLWPRYEAEVLQRIDAQQ